MMQDTDGTTVTPIDAGTAWAEFWDHHHLRGRPERCFRCEELVTIAIREEVEARYKPILAALETVARGGYVEAAHAALLDFYQP